MSQNYNYPSTQVTSSDPSVGPIGDPIPSEAALVGGENPSGDLEPIQLDASGALITSLSNSPADPESVQIIVSGSAIDPRDIRALVSGTDSVAAVQSGTWNINNISGTVSLPTGAATEATLSGISAKLPATLGQKTMANSMAVVIASDQSSLPLPTGAATEATLAAFSDKSASGIVPEPFDYQEITYVGATTAIDQVVYKIGGSGGTVVATLTMGYDGSDRLTSITRS